MTRFHLLKTWPDEFSAVERWTKTAEFRKDDREYKVGDVLLLQEYQPFHGAEQGGHHTGRAVAVVVTHKVPGGSFGVPEGFCVLSISRGRFVPEDHPPVFPSTPPGTVPASSR